MKNYYKILGIEFDSDLNTIKKAYRKLALLYHPDKNKSFNANDLFIGITEAYEILSNTQERQKYDSYYRIYFKDSSEMSVESISTFSKWEQNGANKAREYSEKSYDEFVDLINRITFHASSYLKIGCIGGIFIFLGFVWLLAPIIIISKNNSESIIGPAALSFLMGVGALVIGARKIRELKVEYQIKKQKLKSK